MANEIELRDVEAFVAVVEDGSFTAAARRLGVNQSVISTRVAHLESALQTRLIDRGARQSTPTPAGAALLPRARGLLDGCQQLVRDARRLGDVPRGSLEIAASTVPGTFYLPEVLALLRTHAPLLVADLRLSDTAGALDALRRGDAEVAVVGRAVTDDDVESEPIWTDSVVLVATKDLAARARRAGGIADIPLVFRRPGSATRRAVVDALAARGIAEDALDVALVAPDNEVAREAAIAGVGATFLSERAASREIRAGRLVRLDRLFPPIERPLHLVTPRGRTLSPGARVFVELLRSQTR